MPAALLSAALLTGCAAPAPRSADAAAAEVFRIEPVQPIARLLPLALAATPPAEHGDFRAPELVELTRLEPGIRLDIRYASTRNFLGAPLYGQARAFLQRPAALALARVHRALAADGYGLLVHDAYRPWYVTKVFWDAVPASLHGYVADPAHGSRHNRGCAVDLTLFDLATGLAVAMPSLYDETTERAHAGYAGGSAQERARRDLLRRRMEAEGFAVYESEWWHFDYRDWASYAIQNVRFEDLDGPAGAAPGILRAAAAPVVTPAPDPGAAQDMSPADVVQHQLDAYNARDLARFLLVYADDVQVYRPPATEPSMRGKQVLGEFYATQRFNLPQLHAQLVNRIVIGNTVIDHERVTGIRAAAFDVAVAYLVRDGLIRSVWFYSGE